ncbi:MAG: MBL fold metallo-hydrolase [Oscillospiraceae bacterium]|nr:MBL fold metallo-hydrolase [Oscillospiraceae bacterium]MDD3832775.1 MBL fold metallo-hydrolase [Oscillospiraceae bacterium]MDD4546323.1 MBL fold metallo-hydrolase [Oscillospiraceae bacterium]
MFLISQYICIPVGDLSTNCYLIYDENRQGVVVDPGGDFELIMSTINKNKLHIKHVLLTHVHFDHILATQEVMDATGADLLVPSGDEPALRDPRLNLIGYTQNRAEINLKADRLLEDGDEITAGSLVFNVLNTPGHTPGSSCFILGDLLISGDTLFAGSIGRTDFPGGDSKIMRRSLEHLTQLEGVNTVLPGHGPSTTMQDERRDNPYMNTTGYDFNY